MRLHTNLLLQAGRIMRISLQFPGHPRAMTAPDVGLGSCSAQLTATFGLVSDVRRTPVLNLATSHDVRDLLPAELRFAND
jgi:hypothetical protein